MDGVILRRSLAGIICAAALGAAGCAEFGELPVWVPFQGEISDKLPGITTPSQRIARLRKLSETTAWQKPEQKQRIVAELTDAYRTEEDSLIKSEIVRTIANYPGPEADEIIKRAVNDPDADIRVAACDAWGKRGGQEATAVLAGRLHGDVDLDVRLAAARALGEGRDPAAVAALGRALEDGDPAMQYRAVSALQNITGKDFGGDVNQWRQYVKGETPKPAKPISLADRLLRLF
jgi:HEAT repeat protein